MTTNRTRTVVQGLTRLAALIAVLVGLPAALVVLVGWPLPRTLPRASVVLHSLGGGSITAWPWAKLVAACGWATWALFAATVVAELLGRARGHAPRRATGLAGVSRVQRWVAESITAITLIVGGAPATGAVPLRVFTPPLVSAGLGPLARAAPVFAAQRPMVTVDPGDRMSAADGRTGGARSLAAHAPAVTAERAGVRDGVGSGKPTVTVVAGDDLWDLGARHLPPLGLRGSLRAGEIWALNRGRALTDSNGRARVFADKNEIFPGEVLIMPPDAVGCQRAATVAAPAPAATPPATRSSPPAPSVPSAPASPSAPGPGPATAGSAGRIPGAAASGDPHRHVGSGSAHAGPQQSVPAGPALGVGGLAAAGVIWMLGRRRREQTLNRRTGCDIPATPAPIEAVERRARAIADHEALRWVDLGLRYLGRLMVDLADPPAVVLVRAGSVGLEVLIDPPTTDAPGRFEAVDDGIAWALDPAVDLAELEQLAGDRWPPLPALVTIGETAAGTVLANLEHAGSLAIDGDPVRQRGLLLQILVELTSQPWSYQTLSGVHVLGDAGLDTKLPGVDVDDDPMFMAQVLDQLSDRYQRDIGDVASVAVRRALDSGWEPHVAVAFADAPPDVLRCVVESAVPDRSGVAVVAAGPLDGARWRLEVDATGAATLSAWVGDKRFVMDMRVDPDAEAVAILAADLACAAEPADNARVLFPRDALPDGAAVRKGPVEIAVMGLLEVAGGPGPDAVESKRRRPAMAVLAYIATHRQPVTNQDLARALWPLDPTKANFGGGAPSTVNNVVSHARSILGRGPGGEELLVCTTDGYSFADGVSSDWPRFLKMATVAGGEDPLTRIATWRSALRLVRGVPLAGSYPGKYFEWFGSERLDDKIKSRVVDVASALASAALDVEDWETVRWAVDKGLSLDPAREELFQALMHAEGRSGRPARVQEVYGQLCLMLQREIDMLQTPSDESEEIWKSYTAAGHGNK